MAFAPATSTISGATFHPFAMIDEWLVFCGFSFR